MYLPSGANFDIAELLGGRDGRSPGQCSHCRSGISAAAASLRALGRYGEGRSIGQCDDGPRSRGRRRCAEVTATNRSILSVSTGNDLRWVSTL